MADKSEVEIATSEKVELHFEAKKCIHSRNCVIARPDVFVGNVVGPWIHPERATPEQVETLAINCPSGAIRFKRLDGGPDESAPLVNVMRVRENGPNAIHADMDIVGHGRAFRATLCRCGASKNKPFCDGSHTAAGFEATGEPMVGDLAELTARNGELRVAPTKNGPLHVTGNLEICAGTGHKICTTTEKWLCRCGHSKDKPYCDGSHERAGFVADGVEE